MTAPRRQRKLRSLGLAAAFMTAGVAIGGLVQPATIRAATTEYLVVDRNSGLAISGFDPVAYFIDRVASLGKGDFEASFAGAVWRFRNEGNRGAFMADPDIYMPRFGGYDPIGVARGVAVAGDPRLWTLSGERLYLFSTPEGRELFAGDAEQVVATAERKWPSVKLTLSP
jgi:hypothetical protein